MKNISWKHWPVVLTAIGIFGLGVANIFPYEGNVTALFHMDELVNEGQPTPANFVILDVPAYDGAHYYQVARNIPRMINPSQWRELRGLPTFSYAYQRFLLPFGAFVIAFGQENFLPYAFLLINIFSLIGACWIAYKSTGAWLYPLAIAFSPAAMVGLHFSLAEPLTLLLLTLFLARFERLKKLQALDILLLSLLVLSREVNTLFAGLLGFYFLCTRQWRNMFLTLIPLCAFLLLHGWIYAIFNDIPFLTSAGKRDFPFHAVLELITGVYGYNRLTLTSIPLALLVLIPGIIWTTISIVKKRDTSFATIGALAFLLLMTTMPDHIWGSITSIGRVITPVYPLLIFSAAKHDTHFARLIAFAILAIGLGTGISLATVIHPYTLS